MGLTPPSTPSSSIINCGNTLGLSQLCTESDVALLQLYQSPRVRSNKPTTVCAPNNLVKLILTCPLPRPLQEHCSPVLPRTHKSCRTLMIYQAGLGLPLHLVWWTNQKLISTFVQRGCWLINYYWLWAWLPSAAKRHLKGKKKKQPIKTEQLSLCLNLLKQNTLFFMKLSWNGSLKGSILIEKGWTSQISVA